MKSAYQWGLDHDSCQNALEQRKALGPQKTQADWWLACDRGDWLIWQLQRLEDDELQEVMPALLRAIDTIVDRAVRNHALKCGVPEVRQWAEKWLSGEDRSIETAQDAEIVARAARAAVAIALRVSRAAEAEIVARAAARAAAWAVAQVVAQVVEAAEAAEAAERKQQADDIRAEIPEWVWS